MRVIVELTPVAPSDCVKNP